MYVSLLGMVGYVKLLPYIELLVVEMLTTAVMKQTKLEPLASVTPKICDGCKDWSAGHVV